MDNLLLVEKISGRRNALLKFLFGCNADVAEHGAAEFGNKALDQIEP